MVVDGAQAFNEGSAGPEAARALAGTPTTPIRATTVCSARLPIRVREARAWAGDARTRVGADVSEYLREEVRLLPDRAAVAGFITDVDRLRADTDRLAARVENLIRRQGR